MRRFLRSIWRTAKWSFVVFCVFAAALAVYVVSLAFRDQVVSENAVKQLLGRITPPGLSIQADSAAFGLRHGMRVRGVRICEAGGDNDGRFVAGADLVEVDPLARRVRVVGAKYPRLPDSYYAPENHERNARVDAILPEIPKFTLELLRPKILSVAPDRVLADVEVTRDRVVVDRIRLDWPDGEERRAGVVGFCVIDLARQEIVGEVEGVARQPHIRPMLVALDLPVSLPYIDGFTEVPGYVPSRCGWKVNLVNSDLDLELGLHPDLGKYNGVALKKADGTLKLHVYTRGDWLNYDHTFGPIVGVGPNGEPLEGTVKVSGKNGFNTVEVDAKGALPVADLLRIGGFAGEYVGREVVGESACQLKFAFPRSMTNNYEVLNGSGHVEIRGSQIMRMRGFKGLLALLADKVPGVSWFTDSTQASCDYVIENGVIKTDNIYIEGSVFSIKMYGQFDAVKDALDFTVRVQFTKRDSFMGKILHPLAWPFTKLLLEFQLSGSTDSPEWQYISVVDRVVEAAK